MENRFLEAMKKLKIPIFEDYEFDPILDVDIEINNIEDWKNWYDKIENRNKELKDMMKPHLDRILTYFQKGKYDPNYFFKDLIMFSKFSNFRFKECEFWELSFWWLVEMSPVISDLSPKHIFRIEVLKRDKWTCRKCGRHCNSAHHIFSRIYCQKHAPELEWDIRNGVALCFDCHKAITEDGKKWFEENKN